MILQLFIVVVIIYCSLLRWQARHKIAFSKKFKNDFKTVPILGVGHLFLSVKTDQDRWKIIKKFGEEALKQGGLTCLWNVHKLYFLVADPVIAETIMKSCLEKDDAMKTTIKVGSVVADVPIWRPRRKVLVPTFSQKYLMQFEKVFSKRSMILTEQLQKVAGKSISMSKYLTSYTMDSVCETTLGISNAQLNQNQKVLRAFTESFRLIADRITKPWLHFTPIYKLTSSCTEHNKCSDIIHGFIQEVITEKRKELAEANDDKDKNIETKNEDRLKPILELMIESSDFSDKVLREEIIVMFTAGTDTSALAMSFTLVLLARHPHVQEKLYKELQEIFGNSKRPVVFEDLLHLKYLEAVIKETMRLYPPATLLLRKIDEDVVLPSGLTLPKDTGAFICVHAIHHNPDYWGPDLEIFRPERFIDAPLKHPAAFMPFSTGPRNCIGYRYAMMSMKTVLATLLRHFRILPVSEKDLGQPIDLKLDVMIRATDDFQVVLEPRI